MFWNTNYISIKSWNRFSFFGVSFFLIWLASLNVHSRKLWRDGWWLDEAHSYIGISCFFFNNVGLRPSFQVLFFQKRGNHFHRTISKTLPKHFFFSIISSMILDSYHAHLKFCTRSSLGGWLFTHSIMLLFCMVLKQFLFNTTH